MFNATSNYWIVGGSTTEVYFGGTNTYVPVDDAAYLQWKDAGNQPVEIANEVDLWGATAPRNPVAFPDWLFNGETFSQPADGVYAKHQLLSYSAMVRYGCEIGGTTTVAGQEMRTDRVSRAAADQGLAYVTASSISVNWKTTTGFVSLTELDLKQYIADIDRHVQDCFNIEMNTAAGIEGDQITTLDQIDAAYADTKAKLPHSIKGRIGI
jgi:hypothetical protein